MATQCKAKKKNGNQCTAFAVRGSGGYCLTHSPKHAAARRARNVAGGRAHAVPKIAGEYVNIKDAASLLELLNKIGLDTWQLENSAPRSRAILAAIETGAKVLQIGELEERVKALENRIEAKK